MRANGVVMLDSYRLSQYAESAPCYICDSGNNFDAELCRHCQAPMALAHQALILDAQTSSAQRAMRRAVRAVRL